MTTTDPTGIFANSSLNWATVGRAVTADFLRFRGFLEAHRHADEAQELRGAALQRWATFAPEAIPQRVCAGMRDLVHQSRLAAGHRHFGWIDTLPLCSALACIYADPTWLDEALANLAHHSGGVRDRVSIALALPATLITCDDPRLLPAVAKNFRSHQGPYEHGVAIFAASKGTPDAKLRQISRWCAGLSAEDGLHPCLTAG
jgi:hypothetical protein